jgi:predicted TIM-barrel fold metal-dependent hydrolase
MTGAREALAETRGEYEASGGRLFFLGAFDPRRGEAALERLDEARRWPGFAAERPGVYLDLAGDAFCYRLLEHVTEAVPPNKILFGSDYPWLDPRCNLTRVVLADIPLESNMRILRDNAVEAYRLALP